MYIRYLTEQRRVNRKIKNRSNRLRQVDTIDIRLRNKIKQTLRQTKPLPQKLGLIVLQPTKRGRKALYLKRKTTCSTGAMPPRPGDA